MTHTYTTIDRHHYVTRVCLNLPEYCLETVQYAVMSARTEVAHVVQTRVGVHIVSFGKAQEIILLMISVAIRDNL